MKDNLKLIYISYYFPPIHSVASLRNYFLVSRLKEKSDQTVVLTTTNQFLFPRSDLPTEDLKILSIKTIDYRTLSNIFKFDKRQAHFSESSKSNKLFKFIIKLNETFPFNLFLGEGGLVYIFISFYKARKFLKSGNIQSDILITPFRPMSNVIIGFLLKTFYSKMRWVVSVHDLPINHFRPNVYFKKLQHNIWNRIFTQADYVITLSHGLANDLKTFGANASVVENGINVRSPKSDQNQKFTILYSGSLYQDMIEPFDFFNAIENILKNGKIPFDKLAIIYAGKDGYKWQHDCIDFPSTYSIINCVGNVTHVEALLLQETSNINLLLTLNSPRAKGILTGKLFEYIGARNPILVIVNGDSDSDFEELFEKHKCGEVFYNSDPNMNLKIENFILSKYKSWRDGKFQNEYNQTASLLDQSWEIQADKYWNLINS